MGKICHTAYRRYQLNNETATPCPGCIRHQIHNLELVRRIGELERALEEERRSDRMTGLANKQRLYHEIGHHLALFRRDNNANFSVVFVDIDNFKQLNDRDHLFGDRLIVEFADFLRVGVRSCDIVARFGGDEFCVLVSNSTKEQADRLVKKIQENLRVYVFDEAITPISLNATFGIASTSEGFTEQVELIGTADRRMTVAKAGKKVALI